MTKEDKKERIVIFHYGNKIFDKVVWVIKGELYYCSNSGCKIIGYRETEDGPENSITLGNNDTVFELDLKSKLFKDDEDSFESTGFDIFAMNKD